MKRNILITILIPVAILLGSWGVIGHQTVAKIAENNLNIRAKAAVKDLLPDESLTQISSWADQVRSQPEYRYTSSWHFLNLPDGLDYNSFTQTVKGLSGDNIYTAILKCGKTLSDPSSSRAQKVEALKFMVHLVGDAHQPMHISRAEDKGGNTIQVQFNGKGTNLHSLWDGKLLDAQGLTADEMATKFNKTNPAQILQWQKDPILKWLFESYQISSKLYAEVQSGNKLSEEYYTKHLPEVQLRLEQGGIRLAGILNEVLKNYKPEPKIKDDQKTTAENKSGSVKLKNTADVVNYMGKSVTITDVVSDYKVINNNLTLLNIGGRYPQQILTVALKGSKIKLNPEDLKGKRISVSGIPQLYKDKPEIEVSEPADIYLEQSK